jgi:hypothetical protein
VKIIIDLEVNSSFMSPEYATRHRILVRDKAKPYSLVLADGTPITQGKVRQETQAIRLNIKEHQEEITLDITPIKFDIILGIL